MRLIITLISLFVIIFPAKALRGDSSYMKALQRLDQLEGEEFREMVDSIYLSLDAKSDYRLKVDVTRQLSKITSQRDEIAHIRSLTYLVIYSDTACPELFDEAYRLAKKNYLLREMDYVEDRRSRFYLSQKRYDSAMVHILRMRDIYRPGGNSEVYRNILNLLGDVYYSAHLYNQAELVYLDLYKQYKDDDHWSYWRPYVIMNNLGQIGIKTSNYAKALQWFHLSLAKAQTELHTPDRDNILAYIHIKIAETFLAMGDQDQAILHFEEAAQFPPQHLFEDVQQELVFLKSQLRFVQGYYAEALLLAKSLQPGDPIIYSHYRFIPEIYKLLSEIYEKIGEPDLSLHNMKTYAQIVDSLENEGYITSSMILLAENDHELTRNKLMYERHLTRVLWIGLIILMLGLFIILFLYRRIYLSKLVLVRKSMTPNWRQEDESFSDNTPLELSEKEILEQKDLVRRLQDLMEMQKIYLNQRLTINETAQLLSSNRTYLSRAINNILKTTFPTFINELRIREAIMLITKGFIVNRTQEALAQKSGFANRTVFISVFKKHTGVTPSFFIANYRQQKSESEKENPT